MPQRDKKARAYSDAIQKAKNFLLSKRSKEFFIFMFFFVVAAAFWLLQTLNRDYEAEFSIPLKLKNVPDNVVITTEPDQKLRVILKDKGTTLLNYKLSKKFSPVAVDFKEHLSRRSHVNLLSSILKDDISKQLLVSTDVEAIKPDTLEYSYSKNAAKKVPVRFQGSVSPGRRYYLSDTLFVPQVVEVYASREILDTIRAAYIEPVELDNVADSLTKKVPLLKIKGAKFVPDAVDLTLLTDMYTEKTVEVPVEAIGFPADKQLRAFPSKVKISFQIGLSRFNEVNAEDFRIQVSYEELLKLGSNKYSVMLKKEPRGIMQVRFNPSQIDFLIEETTADGSN